MESLNSAPHLALLTRGLYKHALRGPSTSSASSAKLSTVCAVWDAIQTRTTIMSKVPTANVFGTPADAFDYILNAIIATDPSKREALIKPHLQTFIDHPIIKDITSQSEAHAPADGTLPTTLELKQIQDSLNLLSKAVDCLSKGNPPSKNPPIACKKQKGGENKQQPQCTYSAAAGSSKEAMSKWR